MSDTMRTRRLHLGGHILCLQRKCWLASGAMNWVPENGRRKQGRPCKTWWSTFKEDLELTTRLHREEQTESSMIIQSGINFFFVLILSLLSSVDSLVQTYLLFLSKCNDSLSHI